MRSLDADLGIMAYVLQFAPQSFVEHPAPRHHPVPPFAAAEAPRARRRSAGRSPSARSETGITIFRPTDGLDEGPVVLQKTLRHRPRRDAGRGVLQQAVPAGRAGAAGSRRPGAGRPATEEHAQDERQATYEGWMHDDERADPLARPRGPVYDLIRACNPAPGAWTHARRGEGARVRLPQARGGPLRAGRPQARRHRRRDGDTRSWCGRRAA